MNALSRITTVTDAADSYDLTTVSVIQSELSVAGNATKLQRYLSSSSAAISNYCQRVFQEEGLVDEFRMRPGMRQSSPRIETLQLSRYPVSSVASLTENGAVLVQDVDFAVKVASGQIVRLSNGGDGLKHWSVFPIVVAYVGGYEDIPEDVIDACIITVRARWLGKDRDASVREVVVPGVLTQAYGTGNSSAGAIPPDACDLLDGGGYRVPVIA